MHPTTRHADVARLSERIMVLARDKRALEDENARLRAELAATMLGRYKGHTTQVVDGTLTVILSSGAVYQMVDNGVYTEAETSYRREWARLPAVPGSPAATLDTLTERPAEMAMEASA